MIENAYKIVKTALQQYNGDKVLLLVFCLCLLGLGGYGVLKKDKKMRGVFWYCVLAFLILACPVSAYVIAAYGIGVNVYWRMFWLLPIPLVIAATLCCCVPWKAKWFWRLLGVLVCAGIIVGTGGYMYQEGVFVDGPNSYKLPEEVFQICDTITADANGKEVKAVMPDTINPYVRQYDPSIQMPYGRNATKDNRYESRRAMGLRKALNNKNGKATAKRLAWFCRIMKCNYLVMPSEDPRITKMEKWKFQPILEMDQYVIFRDLKFE